MVPQKLIWVMPYFSQMANTKYIVLGETAPGKCIILLHELGTVLSNTHHKKKWQIEKCPWRGNPVKLFIFPVSVIWHRGV
jgi:hypothetical protein